MALTTELNNQLEGKAMKPVTTAALRVMWCTLVIGTSAQGQSLVYNFEADFSKTLNSETSIWSYRWKQAFTRDGNYPLLPVFTTTNFAHGLNIPYCPIWTASTSERYPFIGVNDSGQALCDPVRDPGCLWPWPNGQSNIHPDGAWRPFGQNALAVVSWLSPFEGFVNIQIRVTDLDGRMDGGGNGVEYYVDKGSAAGNLLSGTIPNGGDTGFIWIYNVPVLVGDRINFIIGPDGPNVFNDSTRLFAEVSLVPEPSSLGLLWMGSLVVVFCRAIQRGRDCQDRNRSRIAAA